MQRLTISIEDDLAAEFDALIARLGYGNRSEAVRDLVRARLEAERLEASRRSRRDAHCVASLSYVYDHHERALAERLAERQHAHHDLTVASMHVHLDHRNCLETVVLQGATAAVQRLAGEITAESGVRHGQLNIVTVESGDRHAHGGKAHSHLKPVR
jgi:CopG family nickel-responsive transcriptional regulator